MSFLFTSALVLLDVIASAALTSTVVIAFGSSRVFHVGPWLVSATSIRNPLAIASVSLIIRSAYTHVPFFGFLAIADYPCRALGVWRRIHDGLLNLALIRGRACRIVYGLMAGSLVVKLTLAYMHPGFWTGDDVEIHEMTFARLFGYSWHSWNLRSPFFPIGVIYPIQSLLVQAGERDPAILVFAGRAVVAMCTIGTLWLTFHTARQLFENSGIALLSDLILATNKLHV